jgi:hypothetical protein
MAIIGTIQQFVESKNWECATVNYGKQEVQAIAFLHNCELIANDTLRRSLLPQGFPRLPASFKRQLVLVRLYFGKLVH